MPKRLVVCCDGTWNTPDQRTAGMLSPTNVTRFALAVAPRGDDGLEQRVFYHRGIGTTRWQRLLGGASGFGMSRDIRDVYRFLVHNFDPGDELFFFGFSRGAFTARSATGFVRNCGILQRAYLDRLDAAYTLYRNRRNTSHPRGVEATLFRRSYSHETRIEFVGVWDTVGALGIPLDGLRMINVFNRRWQFHDTTLSSQVKAAYQALAIDERRGPFKPTLWQVPADHPADQPVEQVWFSGVHSDVGGGYPVHELSDITLLWMAAHARRRGLTFSPGALVDPTPPLNVRACPNPFGPLHNSRTRQYRLMRPFDRQLGVTDPKSEHVASTAVERHQRIADYAPPGLTAYLDGTPVIMPIELTPDAAVQIQSPDPAAEM